MRWIKLWRPQPTTRMRSCVRPPPARRGANPMSHALGIDLGGSSIKAVIVTPEGRTLAQRQVEFDPDADRDWAKRIRTLVGEFKSKHGEPTAGIGVSAPGL